MLYTRKRQPRSGDCKEKLLLIRCYEHDFGHSDERWVDVTTMMVEILAGYKTSHGNTVLCNSGETPDRTDRAPRKLRPAESAQSRLVPSATMLLSEPAVNRPDTVASQRQRPEYNTLPQLFRGQCLGSSSNFSSAYVLE
jgi:hypothetical protein